MADSSRQNKREIPGREERESQIQSRNGHNLPQRKGKRELQKQQEAGVLGKIG